MADFTIKKCSKDETDFIERFLPDIRPADYDELISLTGDNIKQEIIESVNYSLHAYKVESCDNKPLALYGITKVEKVDGFMIWCIGTNELKKYEKSFTKLSRNILKIWLKKYKRLYNFVSIENEKSINWLKWLGAKFQKPFAAGVKNKEFIYFILEE